MQMSQSFNDGNEDFEWRRGAVMTAKENNLWVPMGGVDAEDVEHMQSRVEVFHVKAKLRNLKDTSVCPHCMCKWICEGAAAYDNRSVTQPMLPLAVGQHGHQQQEADINGLTELTQSARLPVSVASNLRRDLQEMGAVDVRELTVADWQSSRTIQSLRPLEQRRVLNALPAPPQG